MSRLLYQFVLTTAVIGLPQSENNKVEEENGVASRMKANERWRWWWRWLPSDEQAKQKEKKNNKRLIYTQSIFADLFNYISRLPIALRLPLHITTTACRRSCAVTISTYLPKAGRQAGNLVCARYARHPATPSTTTMCYIHGYFLLKLHRVFIFFFRFHLRHHVYFCCHCLCRRRCCCLLLCIISKKHVVCAAAVYMMG